MAILRFGLTGLAAMLVLAACGGEKVAMLPDEARLAVACDSLTQGFMSSLKKELMTAMSEGGPANAVSVCKTTAPDIAAEYSETPGWEIRRITGQPRNPENAASEYETGMLSRLAAAEAPPVLYEWKKHPEGDSTFYFFKTIRVADLCLTCHGDPATFPEELRQTLAEEYPDDQATGYAAGDFRGAFLVTVDYPEGAQALMPAHATD